MRAHLKYLGKKGERTYYRNSKSSVATPKLMRTVKGRVAP